MAGLQEIAAIVGIAEVSFRSISLLYDFLQSLNDAPKEIEFLRRETCALQRCLSELAFCKIADDETQAAITRIGLLQAVGSCGEACARLQDDLSKWAHTPNSSLRSKIQFRWHKKEVESVLEEISITKQTAILTIVITQLSLQLRNQLANSVDREFKIESLIHYYSQATSHDALLKTYGTMATRKPEANSLLPSDIVARSAHQANKAAVTTLSTLPRKNQSNLCDMTVSDKPQQLTVSAADHGSETAAETKKAQAFMQPVLVGGTGNQVGMTETAATTAKENSQLWAGTVTTSEKSKNNKIGIFK